MPQRTAALNSDLGDYYLSYGIGEKMLDRARRAGTMESAEERPAVDMGYQDEAIFTPGYDDLWEQQRVDDDPHDDQYFEDADEPEYDEGLDDFEDDFEDLTPVSLRPTLTTSIDEMLRSFERLPSAWMSRFAPSVLRVGLGLIFLWFGTLKFVPGVSPAEELVRSTFLELFGLLGLGLSPTVAIYCLALFEVGIGTGFLVDVHRPALVWMLLVHMAGTALPLLLLPDMIWTQFPLGLTLEGQYIVKNVILIGAAMAIGGSTDPAHGGYFSDDEDVMSDQATNRQPMPSDIDFIEIEADEFA